MWSRFKIANLSLGKIQIYQLECSDYIQYKLICDKVAKDYNGGKCSLFQKLGWIIWQLNGENWFYAIYGNVRAKSMNCIEEIIEENLGDLGHVKIC